MFRGDSTYLYSYLRKKRQGRSQGFLFFYDYYDDLWMSVVYENYTAAYSSSSDEVETCILDRYIYIYIHIYTYIKNENKKDVYKKQTREKQTYSD